MPSPHISPLSLHDALPISREMSHAVLHPALPRVTEPALEFVRQVTAGLTPRPLREQYGLGWGASRKAALLAAGVAARQVLPRLDRKSTSLNSSHQIISYAVPPHLPSFPTRRSSDLP